MATYARHWYVARAPFATHQAMLTQIVPKLTLITCWLGVDQITTTSSDLIVTIKGKSDPSTEGCMGHLAANIHWPRISTREAAPDISEACRSIESTWRRGGHIYLVDVMDGVELARTGLLLSWIGSNRKGEEIVETF